MDNQVRVDNSLGTGTLLGVLIDAASALTPLARCPYGRERGAVWTTV
jgi:hypothetical protein